VAIGGLALLAAACQTVRAAPAPDLLATAAAATPNAAKFAPVPSSRPDATPASHQPASPAAAEKACVPADPAAGSGAVNIGRPGAAMTTW